MHKFKMNATKPELQLMQYRMDVNTSPFDVALAELTRRNASSPVPLLEYDDGEVYAMEQMATAAGIAALKPNRTLFADLVSQSLLPQPFIGTVGLVPSGGARLTFSVPTPCALVLRLGKKVL